MDVDFVHSWKYLLVTSPLKIWNEKTILNYAYEYVVSLFLIENDKWLFVLHFYQIL